MVEFDTIRASPPLTAYIKKPKGTGPFPAVIVFMHRPGNDNAMQKVVDDLAKAGLVGVCHDSYRNETIRETYNDQTIFEDFEASLKYVKDLEYVDANKVSIMGFCMGGRHAYLAAARYPELKSVVAFYGFPGQGTEPSATPMNVVSDMSMPVLGIFGRQDHLFPFEDVEQFRELLHKQSTNNKVVVYDDVGHGFLNPYSPKRHLDGVSAGKAWNETITFYRKYFS